MFGWLTERRRRQLLEEPFPPAWDAILAENVAIAGRLDAATGKRLRDLVQVFVAEKRWEGLGGLAMVDEVRVTIAAQACVLLLGRDHALYEDVESILVYPTTMVAPPRRRGFFESNPAPVDEAGTALLGQAFLRGPVILAWDRVLDGGRERRRGNVVFHELAHKIDMRDGEIDGTPPLDSKTARRAWAAVCEKEFLELRARVAAGTPSFLDDYGATDEAEFFAVVTEAYFTRPDLLRRHEPALHALFRDFYRFEPPERS
jgi:Mlc titration factor MtfA (ptsG expression regulator)